VATCQAIGRRCGSSSKPSPQEVEPKDTKPNSERWATCLGLLRLDFGCLVGSGDVDCDAADQNGDGLVDPLDVGFVLARFGTCE